MIYFVKTRIAALKHNCATFRMVKGAQSARRTSTIDVCAVRAQLVNLNLRCNECCVSPINLAKSEIRSSLLWGRMFKAEAVPNRHCM